MADFKPNITNYFDDTAITGQTYTYTVIVSNSAGAALNFIGINSNTASIPCEPAPIIATNSSPSWLSVNTSDLGSDQATLVWVGPATNWLFQATEFDTYIGDNDHSGTETVTPFVNMLAEADTNSSPLPAWIWSRFTNDLSSGEINSLTGTDSSVGVKLETLIGELNHILTNGVAVSNLAFFVSAVQNDYYSDGYNYGFLRQATTNLFNTFPGGAGLVQLKRMLFDDCFAGKYFTRGGNWGSRLTGFRIHYHTLLYADGRKLEQTLQRDLSLSEIKYDHSQHFSDDEGVGHYCYVYLYSWPIPQGSICWASVSALVDGQEGEVSNEVGPQSSHNAGGDSWNASLHAIAGYHQVYLDWNDDANAFSYDMYFSTNANATNDSSDASWQAVPGGIGLQMNRCWHTGLSTNTTYYYMLIARDYFAGSLSPQFADATVTNTGFVANQFSADASAYDSMVLVEWTVPTNQFTVTDTSVNQTNWQFFVERKPAASDDSAYETVADSGYGLAYLDADVVDGQSYTYRVTAFDSGFNRLETNAVVKGGSSTQITPSASDGLTRMQPTPGNGYVDLTWSPIRATVFAVKRSPNTNGPFDVIDTVYADNVYHNAQNTYRDTGVQNGVMQ